MREELLIRDAFDSIVKCEEALAIEVFKNAEKAGADLVELLTYGYSAGIVYLGEMFCRVEIVLPMLISSTKVLRSIMAEFESKMALTEIRCAGVDYCLFR